MGTSLSEGVRQSASKIKGEIFYFRLYILTANWSFFSYQAFWVNKGEEVGCVRIPHAFISIVGTRKLVWLGGNFAINGCLGSNCWRKVNKHRSFRVGSEYLCIHLLFPRQNNSLFLLNIF